MAVGAVDKPPKRGRRQNRTTAGAVPCQRAVRSRWAGTGIPVFFVFRPPFPLLCPLVPFYFGVLFCFPVPCLFLDVLILNAIGRVGPVRSSPGGLALLKLALSRRHCC